MAARSALATAMALTCSFAWAAEVGWVAQLEPADAPVFIQSGEARRPARYLTPLENGDRIVLARGASALARISLQFNGGTRVELVAEDLRAGYTVHAAQQTPTGLREFLAWAWRAISSAPPPDQPVINAARGGTAELALPLAPLGESRLVAGPRALPLRWTGGEPPFQLTFIDPSGEAMVQTTTSLREFDLAPAGLRPGTFRLRLSDAQGKRRHWQLDVLEAAAAQRELALIDGEIGAAATDPLLRLLALARAGDGEWALEAWLRVRALPPSAASQAVGRLIAQGLIHGED